MERYRYRLGLAVMAAFMLTVLMPLSCYASVTLPEGGDSLDGYTVILYTGNTYGRVEEDPEHGEMGLSAVSALREAYEAAGANVLLFDTGNALHGVPFATVDQGSGVITLMNRAGYTAMTPGPGDFYYGSQYLMEAARQMDFPFLSSNLRRTDKGNNLLQPSLVVEEGGVRYGIFSLTAPGIGNGRPAMDLTGLEFQDPFEVATRQVANLRKQNVKYIIALTHLGVDGELAAAEQLAERVEGIQVVIDGGSYLAQPDGKTVNQSLVAGAGERLQTIGVVVIDPEGGMSAGQVNQEQFAERDTSMEEAKRRVEERQREAADSPIATTADSLLGDPAHSQSREMPLGNMAADALCRTSGADAALLTSARIQSGMAAGEITRWDCISVFPEGRYIVTKKLNGKQIREVLEQSVAAYPEAQESFLQISGLAFRFDSAAPAGSRILAVSVKGRTISDSDQYVIAMDDGLAAGGNGYELLREIPMEGRYPSLEECLAAYLAEMGDVSMAPAGRMLDVQGPPPEIRKQPQTYVVAAGDSLIKIAGKLYGDTDMWREIYQLNRDQIVNPNLIRAGMELKLP